MSNTNWQASQDNPADAAEHNAQEAGFIAAFGAGQTVEIQEGYMAITAALKYDDSDIMTDYFNRHASIGPAFCIALVPKGSQTEAKARAAVARFPELASVPFAWKTEKWSMGHGNYLDSTGDWVELTDALTGGRKHYRGGEVTQARWEIEFDRARGRTIQAFKGWPGNAASVNEAEPAPAGVCSSLQIAVSYNRPQAGIEIRFPSKPSAGVLSSMKAHGWRWSRFSACWYKRATEAGMDYACDVAGLDAAKRAALQKELTGAVESAAVSAYVQAQEEAPFDQFCAATGA